MNRHQYVFWKAAFRVNRKYLRRNRTCRLATPRIVIIYIYESFGIHLYHDNRFAKSRFQIWYERTNFDMIGLKLVDTLTQFDAL
jgi:hypothetical protein